MHSLHHALFDLGVLGITDERRPACLACMSLGTRQAGQWTRLQASHRCSHGLASRQWTSPPSPDIIDRSSRSTTHKQVRGSILGSKSPCGACRAVKFMFGVSSIG